KPGTMPRRPGAWARGSGRLRRSYGLQWAVRTTRGVNRQETIGRKTYNHVISNGYVAPLDGECMDTVNHYTGSARATGPKGSARDVDRAVQAARQAMTSGPYARMTPSERGKMMMRLADLVQANAERLAEIEVRDNGKLLSEMLGQLKYHPEWWRYFGGL